MEVHHEVALATYPGLLPTLSFSWSLVMMFSSPNCDHKQTPHIAHHLIFFPRPPGLQPQANSQILRHLSHSLSLSHFSLSPNPNPHTITKNPCHSPNNHFQTPQPQLLLCHALVTQTHEQISVPSTLPRNEEPETPNPDGVHIHLFQTQFSCTIRYCIAIDWIRCGAAQEIDAEVKL